MRKRTYVFLFLTALMSSDGTLNAQTAEEIERLVSKSAVPWSDACQWAYAAHGEPYTAKDAFFYAVRFKAVQRSAAIDDNADLAGLALVLMHVWRFKGGIFYSIFKNRRYAFREMIYLGVFDKESDPKDSFSGENFLLILSRISALSE